VILIASDVFLFSHLFVSYLLNRHFIKMKLTFIAKSWMGNGRLGRPAKNLLYKHSIAAYTDINGIAAYGVRIRIHHDSTMAELWQHWPKYHKSIMWYFCKSVKCKQNQESKKILNANPSETSSLTGWLDKMTITVSVISKWDFKNWGKAHHLNQKLFIKSFLQMNSN
jgi:hypothetical protein